MAPESAAALPPPYPTPSQAPPLPQSHQIPQLCPLALTTLPWSGSAADLSGSTSDDSGGIWSGEGTVAGISPCPFPDPPVPPPYTTAHGGSSGGGCCGGETSPVTGIAVPYLNLGSSMASCFSICDASPETGTPLSPYPDPFPFVRPRTLLQVLPWDLWVVVAELAGSP
eukprot:RCo027411